MALASAAVKVGFLVKEVAICSANLLWNSGDSVSQLLRSALGRGLGRVKSSVTVGPEGWTETEHGFPSGAASIGEGRACVCSPS